METPFSIEIRGSGGSDEDEILLSREGTDLDIGKRKTSHPVQIAG